MRKAGECDCGCKLPVPVTVHGGWVLARCRCGHWDYYELRVSQFSPGLRDTLHIFTGVKVMHPVTRQPVKARAPKAKRVKPVAYKVTVRETVTPTFPMTFDTLEHKSELLTRPKQIKLEFKRQWR